MIASGVGTLARPLWPQQGHAVSYKADAPAKIRVDQPSVYGRAHSGELDLGLESGSSMAHLHFCLHLV